MFFMAILLALHIFQAKPSQVKPSILCLDSFIEYSSLRDFCRPLLGNNNNRSILLYEDLSYKNKFTQNNFK
jgi:hypothetical protein